MRFKGFVNDWIISNIYNEFSFLNNNSFSRDNLNYNHGLKKNIHYGDILTKYETVKNPIDNDVPYINDNIKTSNGLTELISGDIILADTAEDYIVGKAIEIYNPNSLKLYSGLHTIALRPKSKFSIGYLAYYFNSYYHKKRMFPLIQGIKVYSISKSALSTLLIRFPDLEEQEKISRLLIKIDNRIFTQKKIIEYYQSCMKSIRNILLSAKANIKLGDICEVKKGTQLNSKDFDDNGIYPVINGGINISGYSNNYNSNNMITISEGGNSCGYVNYFKEKFWSGGHNYTLTKKTNFNYDYLFHYLKYKEKDIMLLRVGSGLPNIQKPSIIKFLIYMPNIDIQNNITNILNSVLNKINHEKSILNLYVKEKEYLLNKLFI